MEPHVWGNEFYYHIERYEVWKGWFREAKYYRDSLEVARTREEALLLIENDKKTRAKYAESRQKALEKQFHSYPETVQ
jgi:hypothetical protein